MESRFDSLPNRLKQVSVVTEIFGVPSLLIRKDRLSRPFILWLHGRTADKELDSGRYLRYVRRGINVCAVDLPGHGQRFDDSLQEPRNALSVVTKMADEIDSLIDGLSVLWGFDLNRTAIGGMSAGGLAAIIRLLRPHNFKVAVLESTMGSWSSQREHPMFSGLSNEEFEKRNPTNNIEYWKEIPLLAFHSKHDEWVPYKCEQEFIDSLRARYDDKNLVELVAFDRTGAPYEHVGFGRQSSLVKEIQVEFVAQHLQVKQEQEK
ncbi:MAG: alpha/beta fold hydrolase [Phycisphaerales bacterium]|nr:alpha/beta fold hydrolase [Phycisphaerales bacterium]